MNIRVTPIIIHDSKKLMSLKTLFLFISISFVFMLSVACSRLKKTAHSDRIIELNYNIQLQHRQSSVTDSYNALLLNQKEYDKALDLVFKDKYIEFERPAIDFNKHAAALICFGQCNNGGHDLEIISIIENNKDYIINARHIIPGEKCLSTMAIEFPFWLILFEKSLAQKAVFKIEKIKKDCE